MKKVLIVLVGLVVGVGGGLGVASYLGLLPNNVSVNRAIPPQNLPSPSPIDTHSDFHQHVDLRIVIDGRVVDLSSDEYQSSTYVYKDEHIHLHDNNGSVVHLHKPGVTLATFLKTLDMELTDECLVTSEGKEYCPLRTPEKTLQVIVNGEDRSEKGAYQFQDLDKVLVYFGPPVQSQIDAQVQLITDDACLYSETCPERGKPPIENCVASADVPCVIPQSQPQ
jgi:hypothetical protein